MTQTYTDMATPSPGTEITNNTVDYISLTIAHSCAHTDAGLVYSQWDFKFYVKFDA